MAEHNTPDQVAETPEAAAAPNRGKIFAQVPVGLKAENGGKDLPIMKVVDEFTDSMKNGNVKL